MKTRVIPPQKAAVPSDPMTFDT